MERKQQNILPQNADATAITDVIDLTAFMQADGSIHIKASAADIQNPKTEIALPNGNWVIIRFGYSLTGRQNHPASPEATGLEVDKLDKEAVKKYINTYLDMYKDATGGLMGAKGLQYMILDSYEAGHMTWTKNFPEEFLKRRGYSIKTWIPVLTGRIVQNTTASEKFLWDFRKTIGELIAENHYDVIGEELHKRNMKRYTESHEDRRIYLADGMDVKRNADIPMSAMWTPGSLTGGDNEEVRSEGDIRESASVANIYGKPIVAAESMTSIQNAFSFHPGKLKRTADMELASGLNRFVIHTSVHQPLDDKMPGFSLGPFGQYFTRQETWAEQAKAWIDYLARSSYMLQQGKNIADVLYYYGENQNITWLTREKLPAVPAGYEFDFVNATALLNAIDFKNGKLTAISGNTYQLLVLDESAKNMTLPVLKKINQLVKTGAKLVGAKPQQSPSLSDDVAEFERVVNELWNNPNVLKGSIADALAAINVQEDVVIKNNVAKILYRHRKAGSLDIYWLNNRSQNVEDIEATFRVAGKVPELWFAETGKTEALSYHIANGFTKVKLHMEPNDALFVVFKNTATKNSVELPPVKVKELTSIEGPWDINFQKNRGAPFTAKFNKLASWTDNADTGIKYFSGTATYTKTINASANWFTKDAELWLNLGDVKNIAELSVNGKPLGIVWKKPFRVNVTSALKPGNNKIEIKVTNLWVNRLIGDAQPGVTNKITYTTMPFYQPDAPLLPAGLLGPVTIMAVTRK
ncbi:MAG: glycosyl hydrolase [Flavihumibacter sp.]|nr:glycosyl hydrolase [Flavihumibacter sp.]